jgi:PPP family 3-phenylpropionic acid transporter
MLADLLGSLRLVLATCAALAAGTAAALLLANTFWLLLLIALVQAAALAPTASIADALSVNAAKPQLAGRPFEYGWIRGSASAAFVLGTLAIGQLISRTDLTPIIWMNVALLVAAAGATALVSSATTQSAPHTGASSVAIEVHGLLRISRFRILILVSALVYGSHAMHDAFAVIRWSAAGIDTSVISVLWSEAVAAEVIVFFLIGPALLDRFGARGAAALAAAAGILRWSSAGVTTSVLMLSILQPLHGFDFRPASSCLHAHDGDSCSSQSGRNGPSVLRVWLRFRDCGTDFVVRNSLCQVRRSGILSDGTSLRRRTPVCLVWLR